MEQVHISNIPHGEQSFGIRTWQDMFRKLCFELEEFVITRGSDRDPAARGYRAINLAWTAWHLHDWYFESRMDAGDLNLANVKPAFPAADFEAKKTKRDRLTLFGKELTARFEALRICRTLATAGKHGKAEHQPMVELRAKEVQPIDWMPPGPNRPINYDVRVLVGKTPWDAKDLFVQAIADWRNFFALIDEDVPRVQLSV